MNPHTTTQIAGLYRAVKEIADCSSPDLTLRQLMTLLYVGSKTFPVSQQALVDNQDALKSTISKIVAALSGTEGDVKRATGYGLLSVDLDPHDMRSRLVSLSKEGEKALERATRHLK